MPEPEADATFAALVEDWPDRLGPDRGEGVGLLWKEGGIEALFELLRVDAPHVSAALADRLATTRAGDTSFAGEMLSRYLSAMAAPTRAERAERLTAIDLSEPMKWSVALAQLDPPMSQRFVLLIETWLDRARGIERRCRGAVDTVEPVRLAVGTRVAHAAFGEGVVTAIRDATATVEFPVGVKKVRVDRLSIV